MFPLSDKFTLCAYGTVAPLYHNFLMYFSETVPRVLNQQFTINIK